MSTQGMRFIRSALATTAAETERRQPMVGQRGKRFAAFAPNSYNADAHTVEAALSAGSPVRRFYFTEELEISAAAIDLTRATAGLVPLLDAHNQFEADAVLGTVANVRVVG